MADDDREDDLHAGLGGWLYGGGVTAWRLRAELAKQWIRDWWKALLIIAFFGAACVGGVLLLALPNPPQW